MWRVLRILIALFFLNCLMICIAGFRDERQPADLAVVLGSKVHPDGMPSSSLERRLEKGLELYRSHQVKAVMVSGGLGYEGFQEAAVMRDFLQRRGVPPTGIIEDDHGDNTRLTAIHAKAALQEHGWRSAIVVSQYYHVPRAKLALRQAGIPVVTSAHANYQVAVTDPWSIVREGVGYWAYFVHGR